MRVISLIIIFSATCFFARCKKFVAIDPPKTQVPTSEVFTSDAGALSAIAGLYHKMRALPQLLSNGGATLYTSLSSDELMNSFSSSELDVFANNNLTSQPSTPLNMLWQMPYGTIYQANSILEGLERGTVTDSIKRQLRGEALVIRSFHYFYLVNLFGDVPLVVSTNYETNQSMPRTGTASIYQSITADLEEAVQLLKPAYPSTGRVRVNRSAAEAMLARVYLYRKDWPKAEQYATAVINNNSLYSLTPSSSIQSAFKASSKEAVWQLMRETSGSVDGEMFLPVSTTVIPTYVLRNSLLASFENGDLRRQKWVDSNKVGSPASTYYYPAKYRERVVTTGNTPTENLVLIRLAELYLIRAEARAQQNNLIGAASDLNMIRSRAGLSNSPASSVSGVLLAIEHERQTELFTEWGHRWLDLKRTGRVDVIMALVKGSNWQNTDQLYPIPSDEIAKNPSLSQNPGY